MTFFCRRAKTMTIGIIFHHQEASREAGKEITAGKSCPE